MSEQPSRTSVDLSDVELDPDELDYGDDDELDAADADNDPELEA